MTSLFTSPHELPDELLPYKGRLTPRFFEVREQLLEFIVQSVLPARAAYQAAVDAAGHDLRAPQPAVVKELQAEAKARGLFNLFLPEVSRLSVLEYAPVAEMLGVVSLANVALNCDAPSSGNMEVLLKFGSPYQKERFLQPLLSGDVRCARPSCRPTPPRPTRLTRPPQRASP